MTSAYSTPLLISSSGVATSLERVPLSGPESKAVYSEDWLQDLLYRFPSALPIAEIDNSFLGLIPVCREMNTPAGPVDVVYVTPNGRPVIVEAKLWRNPEARRKVVGQILDYAKELGGFSYESFDAAVRAARRTMEHEDPPRALADIARQHSQAFDEAQFCDSLTRNLRRGDFLLLIVGDGIREGVGAIADFLESHGTLHFTFGLVEMAVYKTPEGGQLVQPRVLAQSEIVRRVVLDVRDSSILVQEAAEDLVASDPDVSEEILRNRERFETFWREFLDKLVLDDKSQPISPAAKTTNQYFMMPKGSNAWISAYLLQSGQRAGVYLTFSKGPTADRLYAALLDDREAIEKELGLAIEWESEGGKHWISAPERDYQGRLIEDHGQAIQAMMADRVNRFVNVFRPRLEALVRESE